MVELQEHGVAFDADRIPLGHSLRLPHSFNIILVYDSYFQFLDAFSERTDASLAICCMLGISTWACPTRISLTFSAS
jgi:hypothetical protein